MHVHKQSSKPTDIAPEEGFTGRVTIRGYFRRQQPSRLAGAIVTYPPGARSPWKVIPAGQTVVVTSGTGWAQSRSGEVVELHVGDVAWFPPGERHWEGATPTLAMTCVALHESTVEFLEWVTEEQYWVGPPGTNNRFDAAAAPGDDSASLVQPAPEGARS